MNPDVEFPVPNRREEEAVRRYLEIEREFIAATNFYDAPSNLQYRSYGAAVIARIWERRTDDAYIPYLALNYFDRFVSRNALPEWQGCTLQEQLFLVTICCVTLSYKMRTEQFSLHQFLNDQGVSFTPDQIMIEEFHILEALDWRMRSITPFYFLDYFYPGFKRIGGFKRQCINELIVQCQGVHHFSVYKPSQIAQAALLAATYIAYRSEMDSFNSATELSNCWRGMLILCRHIDIYTESGTVFRSDHTVPEPRIQSEVAETQSRIAVDTIEEEEEDEAKGEGVVVASEEVVAARTEVNPRRQDEGKAVMVADASEEIVPAESEVNPQGQDKAAVMVADASEEIVPAESEVNPQGQDTAAVVQEIYEEDDVQAESEYHRIRRARGKAKMWEEGEEAGKARSMSEITPAAEAAPKRLMNFRLKWLVPGEQGDLQFPHTTRRTQVHSKFNNCCTLM